MFFYQAKALGTTDDCRLALLVDLGFHVCFRVTVELSGCEEIHNQSNQHVQRKIVNYISDWLSGHGKIYVETFKQSICDEEVFLAKVYSDFLKTACLNEDLLESGLIDFREAQNGWSA